MPKKHPHSKKYYQQHGSEHNEEGEEGEEGEGDSENKSSPKKHTQREEEESKTGLSNPVHADILIEPPKPSQNGEIQDRFAPYAINSLDIVEMALCPTPFSSFSSPSSSRGGDLLCVITRTAYSNSPQVGDNKILFYTVKPRGEVVDYMKLLYPPKKKLPYKRKKIKKSSSSSSNNNDSQEKKKDEEGEHEEDEKEEEEEGEEESSSATSAAAGGGGGTSNNNKSENNITKSEYVISSQPIKTFSITQEPQSVCFLPNGSHCLVGASEGRIFVIQLATLSIVKEITNPSHSNHFCISLNANSNSSLVVATLTSFVLNNGQRHIPKSKNLNSPLVVYDVKSFFKLQDEFMNHVDISFPTSLAKFSPSTTSNRIGTFAGAEACVLDIDTSGRYRVKSGVYEVFTALEFSYDGTKLLLASCSGYGIDEYSDIRIACLDISKPLEGGEGDHDELHKQVEKQRSDRNITVGNAPLLFHLKLTDRMSMPIFSMRVVGRHTLFVIDADGMFATVALAGYEEDDIESQAPNYLSQPPRSICTHNMHTTSSSPKKENVLYKPDMNFREGSYMNGNSHFYDVLASAGEDFLMIAATTSPGKAALPGHLPHRDGIVTVGLKRMNDWFHKRHLFLVSLKGESKISVLLNSHWVPMYLTSKFL